MSEDITWMTYQDLADRLGIGAASAKNLVRRRGWVRQGTEDGIAQIGVPEVELAKHTKKLSRYRELAPQLSVGPYANRKRVAEAAATHVDSLREEVDRLATLLSSQRDDIEHARQHATSLATELAAIRTSLAKVTAQRDSALAHKEQVAVLTALLEAERKHGDEIRADRDHWRQAVKRWTA